MKHFWVTCLSCGDQWLASYWPEFGMLTAEHENGEHCTDCGGEIEIGEEYEGSDE